jgi:hypothetical protein
MAGQMLPFIPSAAADLHGLARRPSGQRQLEDGEAGVAIDQTFAVLLALTVVLTIAALQGVE